MRRNPNRSGRPTPDMHWTGWALTTRYARAAKRLDMRCKLLTRRQQERAHDDPKAPPPAFGLIQARLTRSGASGGRPDRPDPHRLHDPARTGARPRARRRARRQRRGARGPNWSARRRRSPSAESTPNACGRWRGVRAGRGRRSWTRSWTRCRQKKALQAVCRKIGHPPVRLPQSWDEGGEMTPRPPRETETGRPRKPRRTGPRRAGRGRYWPAYAGASEARTTANRHGPPA